VRDGRVMSGKERLEKKVELTLMSAITRSETIPRFALS